jgi:hypothetical protein
MNKLRNLIELIKHLVQIRNLIIKRKEIDHKVQELKLLKIIMILLKKE